MNIFEKWNDAVDGKKLASEVKEIEKNGGGDFPEIPHGEYEISVAKMELKESSTHKPMFAAQFKILEGDHKGSYIFMNQVVLQPFQIGIVNDFLRSMETEVPVAFDGNYEHWNNVIMDVAEAIDNEKLAFLLSYSENKKGYNTFNIKEVYQD